jgi:hypothetical protein
LNQGVSVGLEAVFGLVRTVVPVSMEGYWESGEEKLLVAKAEETHSSWGRMPVMMVLEVEDFEFVGEERIVVLVPRERET